MCFHNKAATLLDINEALKIRNPNSLNDNFNRTNLLPDEVVLDVYSCAVKQNILVHGFLYVTTQRLIFFSHFNDRDFASFLGAFFGMGEESQTMIIIDLKDVKQIYKCVNALIFHNSIGVRMKE